MPGISLRFRRQAQWGDILSERAFSKWILFTIFCKIYCFSDYQKVSELKNVTKRKFNHFVIYQNDNRWKRQNSECIEKKLIIFDFRKLNPFISFPSDIELYQLIIFYKDFAFRKLSYFILEIFCDIYDEVYLECRLQLQNYIDRVGINPMKCSQIRDFQTILGLSLRARSWSPFTFLVNHFTPTWKKGGFMV